MFTRFLIRYSTKKAHAHTRNKPIVVLLPVPEGCALLLRDIFFPGAAEEVDEATSHSAPDQPLLHLHN